MEGKEAMEEREAAKKRLLSEAVGGIDGKYVEEAGQFWAAARRERYRRRAAVLAAAVFFLSVLAAGVGRMLSPAGEVVYAYAYGTDERITEAGAVLHTGSVTESGEQKGHPLMFYLSGGRIRSVRFSCKNQGLVFRDWTEKRDEYGRAQNFTVAYGEKEEEYPYLTVDWEPAETIRRLHGDCAPSELPEELREDLIVMEITFMDGSRAVKAIRVSLLQDGTFFAAFGDYEIGPSDSFVERQDAPTLREQTKIRLSEGEEENERETDREVPMSEAASGDETADAGERMAARRAAEEYYGGTVFEVVSMREKQVSKEEIVFLVSVKKDGILQEPDRTILLQKQGEEWVVANEGY